MRMLDRYVQLGIFRAFILVGIGLVALFSLFDFVEQLRSVGEGRYGVADAFKYVVLTAPGRFLRLTPPSVLLASLMALGAMASSGELTALRALGVSKKRIVIWVFELGAVIMVLLFLIAQYVVPPAQRRAEFERDSRLAPTGVVRTNGGFWARGERGYVNVREFSAADTPADIDIFVFRDDGSIQTFTHAARAEVLADGNWDLLEVTSKTFSADRVTTLRAEQQRWMSFLSTEQVKLLKLPPEAMAPTELFDYVNELKRQHQHTSRFEQQLWSLIAIPFATAAMILIAIPFVFGSFRAVSVGQRITVGILIGIAFSLSQQIVNYLGLLLSLDPAFSALAPAVAVLIGASIISARTPQN